MEIECKYAPVTPGAFQALVRDAALIPHLGPAERTDMRTTYFDLPDGALRALRYTLRLRLENGRPVCCFKGPAGARGARLELEAQAACVQDGVRALLQNPGLPPQAAALLRRGGFAPRCGAAFTRDARRYDDGSLRLILSFDQGSVLGGGRSEPLSEVELEYAGGELARFYALCDALARRHGLTPCPASKAKRALALWEEKQ